MDRDVVEELKQKKKKEINTQYLAEKARLLYGQIRFFFLRDQCGKFLEVQIGPYCLLW